MMDRKQCRFCKENININYKDVELLSKFVTEKGKILPRKATGLCAYHQRQLAKAIKRARVAALMPFVNDFYK